MSLSLPPNEAIPHIEIESAGYIQGHTGRQRASRVRRIWDLIRRERDHYRASGHRPVSSPALVQSSKLKRWWSELHIDDKPGRHIIYMDTLCLAFRRASIQCRLEVKQPSAKKSFAEVTIKIGKKAEERIEEAVPVNLDTLREKGFQKAISDGIKSEIKAIDEKKGPHAAAIATQKYRKFKKKLNQTLLSATQTKLGELNPYALIHLHRSTIETKFSPQDHCDTELEVKTDECEFETVLGHTGEFAQIEFEHRKGDKSFFRRELEKLLEDPSLGIVKTNDSKEDPGMRLLEPVLLPQNNSSDEARRVMRNRRILESYLSTEFHCLNIRELGIEVQCDPSSDTQNPNRVLLAV